MSSPLQWSFPLYPISLHSSQIPLLDLTESKRLFVFALSHPLTPSQSQKLIKNLKENPKLSFWLGLEPFQVPQLVACNAEVAGEMLLFLIKGSQKDDFLRALAPLSLSLASVQVVHRLLPELEKETLNLFLHSFFQQCYQEKEDFLQSRKITLVFYIYSERNSFVNYYPK